MNDELKILSSVHHSSFITYHFNLQPTHAGGSDLYILRLVESILKLSVFKKTWKKRKPYNTETDEAEKPARPINVEKSRTRTFDRAVNLLAFKQRSVNELRTRLLEKDWTNAEIVDEVIEKLAGYGYLNDVQFAKSFAASQIRQKPIGKRVLKQKLALKKLDKETVDEAIEKAFEDTPEAEIIERAIEKRLRIKGKPETREDTKKFFDFLLRQGFSFDLVRDKMREIAKRDFENEE